ACSCPSWKFAKKIDDKKPDCLHLKWYHEQEASGVGYEGIVQAPAHPNGATQYDELTRTDYEWMRYNINKYATSCSTKNNVLRWLTSKLDAPVMPAQQALEFRVKRMVAFE